VISVGWHGYTAAVCGVAMGWPLVIPAKAGIQGKKKKTWIPAFAGMTKKNRKKKNGFPLSRE